MPTNAPSPVRLTLVAEACPHAAPESDDMFGVIRLLVPSIDAFRTLDRRVRQLRRSFAETPEGTERGAVAAALVAVWRDYGISLAELLTPPARHALAAAVEDNDSIMIQMVTHDDPTCLQLASLPWESLWLDELGIAIGLHSSAVIVRVSSAWDSERPYVHAVNPLTVAMAIYGPYGSGHIDDLDTDAEWEAVVAGTTGELRSIRVTEVDANDFGLSMLVEADVLHVSSHGTADSILLGQWGGAPRHVAANEFVNLIESSLHVPPVVVLSTCISGGELAADATTNGFTAIAPIMCGGAVRCVIAMRDEETDYFAADFSYFLYKSIATAESVFVDETVARVRRKLAQSFVSHPELMDVGTWAPGDWFLPIVYQSARVELAEAKSPTKPFPRTNQNPARAHVIRRPALMRALRFATMTPSETALAIYGPGTSGKSSLLRSLCEDDLAVGRTRSLSGIQNAEDVMESIAALAAEGLHDAALIRNAISDFARSPDALAAIRKQNADQHELSEEEVTLVRKLLDFETPIQQRLSMLPQAFPPAEGATPCLLLIWDNFEDLLSISGEIATDAVVTQILQAVVDLPPCRLTVLLSSRRQPCLPSGEPFLPGINVGPMSFGQARRLISRSLGPDETEECLASLSSVIGLYPGAIAAAVDLVANGQSVGDAIDAVYNELLDTLGPADLEALGSDERELLAYCSVFRRPVDWSAFDYVAMIGRQEDEADLQRMVALLNLLHDYSTQPFPAQIDWSMVAVPTDIRPHLPRLCARNLSLRYTRAGLHRLLDRLMTVGLIGVHNQTQDSAQYEMLVPRWIHTYLSETIPDLVLEGHRRALDYWIAMSAGDAVG